MTAPKRLFTPGLTTFRLTDLGQSSFLPEFSVESVTKDGKRINRSAHSTALKIKNPQLSEPSLNAGCSDLMDFLFDLNHDPMFADYPENVSAVDQETVHPTVQKRYQSSVRAAIDLCTSTDKACRTNR